jgi:hypothetical protein
MVEINDRGWQSCAIFFRIFEVKLRLIPTGQLTEVCGWMGGHLWRLICLIPNNIEVQRKLQTITPSLRCIHQNQRAPNFFLAGGLALEPESQPFNFPQTIKTVI